MLFQQLRFRTLQLTTWILLMHKILYEGMLKKRLPSLEKNKSCLPLCFSNFNSCRIVLDCTEIQCEIPTNMETRRVTFSHYKQRHTFKGIIGVAPNGVELLGLVRCTLL